MPREESGAGEGGGIVRKAFPFKFIHKTVGGF